MERKILWLLSFIVIATLWFKIDTNKDVSENGNIEPNITNVVEQAPSSDSSSAPESVSTPELELQEPLSDDATSSEIVTKEDEHISEEEQAYFDSHPIVHSAPDFAAITDIKTRKEAFFDYLSPFIIEKNQLLLRDRTELERILNNSEPPNREEKRWLKALYEIFRLPKVDVFTHEDISKLFLHVDVIPQSLVLAQAANESAWGTSRFATEGNNYFGQWCFRKGCGLVPESRDDEADHEVRRFKDARESVFAYIDNLNINAAYRELRQTRAALRANNQEITGKALVHGLTSYSQRGLDYVEEIDGLIDYNKLWRFNKHHDLEMEMEMASNSNLE